MILSFQIHLFTTVPGGSPNAEQQCPEAVSAEDPIQSRIRFFAGLFSLIIRIS